jgi:hypothetical protein
MKAIIALALAVAACGKSSEQQAREEAAKANAASEPATPPPTTKKDSPPPVAKKEAAPPEPEPTTPAEIDRARNQAMIDGRDKDVLKYCALGKLDDKSNPQALLGCALAACRINDADTAKQYAKPLPKLLMDQAKHVCATKGIGVP